jgi:hypothetical protein
VLDQPLVRSKDRLLKLLDTVCPNLPAELSKDLSDAIWCLIYHFNGLSQKCRELGELEEELCRL